MRPLVAVFIGDTQQTLFAERLVGRESNPEARTRLLREVRALGAERYFAFGDLVAYPSSANWRELDIWLAALRSGGATLAVSPGNHDLWPFPRRGYAALRSRELIPRGESWQRFDVASVRVFLLDSNRAALPRAAFREQVLWLEHEVELAHRDPTVGPLLFVSHHPPFTNSTVTSDEERMLTPLLDVFRSCRKRATWLSGHVHAYERFEEQGRTLVVSGSSGSPRVLLKKGKAARHNDLAAVGSPSPFGWLELRADATHASLSFRGFRTIGSEVATYDQFAL
ncbi:MAG: metallophosphoesterase [Polyangiaceae bacterium]